MLHLNNNSVSGSNSSSGNSNSMALVATPENAMLDAFKNDVRTWMELDSSIRRLQAALKDRRAAKKALTERIVQFMGRYNIEDIDTRDGCIRYKMAYVRAPLSQTAIKDRISTYFSTDAQAANELQGALFGNRERAERPCLRRLRPSTGIRLPHD